MQWLIHVPLKHSHRWGGALALVLGIVVRSRGFSRSPLGWGIVLMLGCLLPAPAQTSNAPVAPTLKDVNHAMSQAETIFTRFVQERHLSLFTEPLRSEGFLCFQKPGRIRWEITQPYKSILVSDGAGVAQFEWVEDKWKKLDVGLAAAMQNVVSQIAGVMEGRYSSNQRDYEATLTNAAGGPVITLVPRNEAMRKMMQAIEVHLTPDLKGTRRVVLRETGGDYTDIRFEDQQVGWSLPPRTFDRNAPLAVEEIKKNAGKRGN
ncbi:MAG: outer membrane lipoprotein carrier protein LolA [Verrucomicrobiota bacterium]